MTANTTMSRHALGAVLGFGHGAGPLHGLGRMFYMVDPAETTFETPQEVPFYWRQVGGGVRLLIEDAFIRQKTWKSAHRHLV